MRKLKVLYKAVGRNAEEIEIDDTLEAKQKLVGGLIEVVGCGKHNLVCNEEGKLMGLYPNIVLNHNMICGNFFLANSNYETGEFDSLTEDEIESLKQSLFVRSVKYSPTQMKEVLKQEKLVNKAFEKDYEYRLSDYYEQLESEYETITDKEEIVNLMNDMHKDLYKEPNEQDIKDMEKVYCLSNEKRVMDSYQEFREQSRQDYDFEEREEI